VQEQGINTRAQKYFLTFFISVERCSPSRSELEPRLLRVRGFEDMTKSSLNADEGSSEKTTVADVTILGDIFP
jgi:hypothetical protein